MKKMTPTVAVALFGAVLLLGCGIVSAQPGPDMDPAQMQQMMQQRMKDSIREQFAVTDDAEWKVIEGRLTKVLQLKTESMFSNMGGMRGMMGRNRGEDGQAAGPRGFPGSSKPSPEAEALQHAVDSNAPADQIKAALDKYREARKKQQVEVANAQEQLKQVLSLRQEAILVSMGLVD